MIELVDKSPDINVQPAEYRRLLGYPSDHALSGRALELANNAQRWYARNGKPWIYARRANNLAINNGSVRIDGVSFASPRLQSSLQQAEAKCVFLVAVSAGPELELESQKLWREEKPDEYFFLEVFGSAVVEHLITMYGARLCAWAESEGLAVLPHASPGYPDWDVAQQPTLLQLIRQHRRKSLPGQLDVLDSGMLRPKKSLLAVFGLTHHTADVARLTDLNPCEGCSFLPCQYRRAPYRRAPQSFRATDVTHIRLDPPHEVPPAPTALNHQARYAVNTKALSRWAGERLTLFPNENGSIDALFRYEGTTCTNLGRRLLFHYRVTLGPRSDGYPIQSQSCEPAPGDDGYQSMCQFLDNPPSLMAAIDQEKPLLGQPLNNVLAWESPTSVAGCYCELSDRTHKWRLVLETIHYALVELERRQPQSAAMPAVVP